MRKVRQVKMGDITFGDGVVRVQSMLSVPSTDIEGSVRQAKALEEAGCEIIRAAIQSIDKGQFEAAQALGMSYWQTMGRLVIPQSFRRLIPPVANEFIMVLKDASLVSIIALSDLTFITKKLSVSNATPLVYIPSMLIYLAITAFFTYIFNRLEKKFSIYE